jgi:diguanylate cyclase (GGDEF)-like protein/PAS domain S-box-containing protein
MMVDVTSALTPDGRDHVLSSLLESHPDAWVVAINPDGFFVPMPAAVPLAGQRVIHGAATALELVVPDDRVAVVDSWSRAKQVGAYHADVHPMVAPESVIRLQFVDMTHRHNVFIGAFVSDENPVAGTDAAPVYLPRLATVRKAQLGEFLTVDDALTRILGWSADEMVGRRSLDFIHPDDHQRAISHWMDMLTRKAGNRQRIRLRHQHKDGRWVWFEVTNESHLDEPDGYVLCEMIDVSDEMAVHEALRASEQLLRTLTESLPVGVLQVDVDGRVVHRNERLVAIVGAATAGTVAEQLAAVVTADRDLMDKALTEVLTHGADGEIEVAVADAVRGERRCAVALRAVKGVDDGQLSGAILCVADITEAVHMREELTERATYDELTGSLNRASTMIAMDRAMRDESTQGTGVVFVDLDGFKKVNDDLGHAAGDRLLAHVAARLTEVVRNRDLVGRLGGDEFLVILRDVAGRDQALALGHRLAAGLGEPVRIGDQDVVPQASLGVAWCAPGTGSAEELIARADTAMYRSKAYGSGQPVPD